MDWREAIERRLDDSGGAASASGDGAADTARDAGGEAPQHTGLALQFELRELIPRTQHRWNGPTSRAFVRGQADPVQVRLGVRPAARTAKGWARGSLTWSNLPHLKHRMNLDPAQHRWFAEFAALHRAANPPAVGQEADWLLLDDAPNPVLWSLFAQADRLGIPFLATARGVEVEIGARAELVLEASRAEAPDDSLRLAPRLTIDHEPADLDAAGAVGEHGVYAYDRSGPSRIRLAPLALDAEQLAILTDPARRVPLEIPPADVEAFRTRYLPELQRRIDVVSIGDALAVPAAPAPLLVLVASFRNGDRLQLRWHWQRSRASAPQPAARSLLPPDLIPDAWLGDGDTVPRDIDLDDADAAAFSTDALPRLRRLPGVLVETQGAQPAYRRLDGAPHLQLQVVPSDRPDWFDLGVTVTVGGVVIPFVPLFRALARGRTRLKLVDGSWFSLAHPSLTRLHELIDEARHLDEWETPPPSGARLSRHQAGLFDAFEDLSDSTDAAREWRDLVAAVDDAPTAVAVPTGLRAELRPYQADGLAWLAFLHRHRLGGVLADDMGLGKTLQCLALIQHAREQEPPVRRPFLIVAPTSVVPNWLTEAARFTPDLAVRAITSTEAAGADVAATASGADVVVTSYALLRLDAAAYQAVGTDAAAGWAGLVLDEAQQVKNAGSRGHEVASELVAPMKLAVTGTPLENSLTDLHALFRIVAPGLFASRRRFREEYVRTIEGLPVGISRGRGAGAYEEVSAATRAERTAQLRNRIRPFLLRRTKEQVAPELPEKQEQTLAVELSQAHAELYDVFLQRERQKLFGLIADLDRQRFIVFRSLTLLRMLALDASLISDEYSGIPSAKLDALVARLTEIAAEGHRALVFSQFTSFLRKAESRLAEAGIATEYLDGGTRDRGGAVDAFRDGAAPVFLISLKAGGFGLNLTEADYVFLLDPWWNPAAEQQAIDRTHRIGQAKPVMVYRLIASGTIEEKVQRLQQRKAALVEAVIDEEGFSQALSADDVRELLA